MSGFTSKSTGWLFLITGLLAALSIFSLLVFAVGYLGDIPSLLFFGPLNDVFGAVVALFSAILALALFGVQRKQSLPLSIIGLLAACFGA